jgi:lysophospholipase L1-like esterase
MNIATGESYKAKWGPFLGRSVAFIGDSLTAESRVNYVSLFLDRVAAHIDLTKLCVVNSGVDSSSVFDALDRVPELDIEHDPDTVFILLGINDSKIFRRINEPLVDLQVFGKAYKRLLELLDARRARKKVLITPPPLLFGEIDKGAILAEYWRWDERDYERYVDIIRATAGSPGVYVADVFEAFRQYTGEHRLYYEDGVHPNAYGHRIIAETLVAVAKQFGTLPDRHA